MARAECRLYITFKETCCVRLESIWWRLGYPVDVKKMIWIRTVALVSDTPHHHLKRAPKEYGEYKIDTLLRCNVTEYMQRIWVRPKRCDFSVNNYNGRYCPGGYSICGHASQLGLSYRRLSRSKLS